jgi:peptide/nickel transport system substrate-binding protein
MDHPARFSNIYQHGIIRFCLQYLTRTDPQNITHPYLLKEWEASEDLETWTLHLREDVTWNTGEPFVADDVIFTFEHWLDEEVGSSMLGLLSYLQSDNVEKVDDYTVRLHLDSPQLAVPEHLYHYPALILDHRTFEGDWLENPVGTGPFLLEEYVVGERIVLTRREDYWEMGVDGEPLPYLDGLMEIDLGEEQSARVAALQAGDIDVIHPNVTGFQTLKDNPDVVVDGLPTSWTQLIRMRADVEPFSDNRVRKALKLCQDKKKFLELAYYGEGLIGPDTHASPVHPEFCPMDPTPYDPEQAKQLLAEAGYPDGLDLTITMQSGVEDAVAIAEILKQDAAAAGFRITVNPVPSTTYWDQWTEVDLGITNWSHRPLAVMVMPLAYLCRDGEPVPWNETRWCDDEFNELLTEAMGTLDVEERRELMCQIQQIQVERGTIGVAYWMNRWVAYRSNIHNVVIHPSWYTYRWSEIWKETEAA